MQHQSNTEKGKRLIAVVGEVVKDNALSAVTRPGQPFLPTHYDASIRDLVHDLQMLGIIATPEFSEYGGSGELTGYVLSLDTTATS